MHGGASDCSTGVAKEETVTKNFLGYELENHWLAESRCVFGLWLSSAE